MREVLAQAAFQLFLERGFERTTVDDIVALAGVGLLFVLPLLPVQGGRGLPGP